MMLIGAVCVVLLGFVLAVMGRRHMKRFENVDLVGIEAYLSMLLKRGKGGAFLIVEDMGSERFLQFRKYVTGLRVIGIECYFPLAPWSVSYQQDLERMLTEQHLKFEEASGSGEPVANFIRIDFGPDAGLATRFVGEVFARLFGVADFKVRVRSHGISARDELINR
jgi:hypothetical protein